VKTYSDKYKLMCDPEFINSKLKSRGTCLGAKMYARDLYFTKSDNAYINECIQ